MGSRPWRKPGANATTDPAPPPPPPPAPRNLVASVATVRLDGASWKERPFGDRAWQTDAWRLYDITGQHRFVSGWVGSCVSRCRLYVAEVNDDGEAAAPASDPQVASLAAGPLGRGPAKDEALRLLGINLFVAGECYIVAEADGIGPGQDRWYVVSGRQIKTQGDRIMIKRGEMHGGGTLNYREGTDLLLRVWTPHPAQPDEPDSPTRSAIPDLREIEAIRKREFAELDSRLSGAGLLGLPEGIDFPRGDDDPTGVDGFMKLLTRAMSTSLQDRASAEAMVPIMFTAPADALDKIRHLTFWSELSDQLLPLREAAVRSLAQSLDVPPEVLLGLGSTNHWSAWAISEEAITVHIKPVLSRIADALTTGYLRGALEHLGIDPDRYTYEFDAAPLTTRPNRAADALNFHERGLISDESARMAGAWNTEDAPDDDERLRRLALRVVQGAPTMLADPTIRDLLGMPAAASDLLERIALAEAGAEIPPDDDDGGGAPRVAEPRSIPDRAAPSEQPPAAAALAPVAGQAVRRALSLAGSRLVPHRQRDRWPDTPRHQLHTRHGLVDRAAADAVLRGAWDDLPEAAAELGVDADALQRLLHGFCVELLVRGMAYDPVLVRELVVAAALPARRQVTAGAR